MKSTFRLNKQGRCLCEGFCKGEIERQGISPEQIYNSYSGLVDSFINCYTHYELLPIELCLLIKRFKDYETNSVLVDVNDEGLLTEEEMRSIEEDVASNPIWRHPFVLTIGKFPTSVEKVTPKNGLIFIKGNDQTGYQHIVNRHAAVYNQPTWKQKDGASILNNPTRFSPNTPPIRYPEIADKIFDTVNLNKCSNTCPERFDVIEGDYTDDIETVKYRLVLYKGTRIIHSFYPVDRKLKRKKLIDLVKGNVTYTKFAHRSIVLFRLPYLNEWGEEVFRVSIFQYHRENREEAIVEAFDSRGEVTSAMRFGERPLQLGDADDLMIAYQYAPTEAFEKAIRELIKAKS